MDVRIRKATRDDRDALVDFNAAMARETEDKILSHETLSRGVDAVFADGSKGFYLIAESKKVPAGALLVTSEWSDWRNAYFWWIQSVYVVPDCRRQGVYTELHRHVETMAAARGDVCGIRLYVDHDNARAKVTYERVGMNPARYDLYEWP